MRRDLHLRACLLPSLFALIACSEDSGERLAGNSNFIATSEPPHVEFDRQSGDHPSPSDDSASVDDSQSVEAAREVLVRYVKLLETAQSSHVRQFWTEGSDPGVFETQLEQFERFCATIGDAGPMEGAAGSVYIDFPLRLDGQAKDGSALALVGTVTLRRANDVPGSTEMQRRWHIYRVDLQPRP